MLEYTQSGKCEKKQQKRKYRGFCFQIITICVLGVFPIYRYTCTFSWISVPGPIIQGEAACHG